MYANIVETEEKKLPEIKINRWRWCGFLPLCCKTVYIISCETVLNRVSNFVWVCEKGFACVIDLICRMNFVCIPSIQKQ